MGDIWQNHFSVPFFSLVSFSSEGILFSRLFRKFHQLCVFKNVGDWYVVKNSCPVSLLSVVSEIFEKLENKMLLDHLEYCFY